MRLSLAIGLGMLAMKVSAYFLTGSAAILSDAVESIVHVAAVCFAAYSFHLSRKPADASHLYGHAKIAFFSAGFEGAMILLAAGYILLECLRQWIAGLKLEHLGWGTALTAGAAVINGVLGGYLVWIGRRQSSLILAANGKHVLTDCWTSGGVVVGLILTQWTGWLPWDPICGMAVAINILWSGVKLLHSASAGLMDRADPAVECQLRALLERETTQHGISYHKLRHRNLGDAHWVEVNLLYPPGTSLGDAHRTATAVESAVERALRPRAHVATHLECKSDHDALHPHEIETAG